MIDKCLRRVLAVLTAALIVFLCVLCAVTIHRTHEEAIAAEEEAAYWADYDFFIGFDDPSEDFYALWLNLADRNPSAIDSYGLYVLVDNPEDLALIYNNFIVLTYESNPLHTYDSYYDDPDEEESIHDGIYY